MLLASEFYKMGLFCVLVCVTLLGSNSVFSAQIPDLIDDDIQYQNELEPPQDIRVKCNSNEIIVDVDTVHKVFNGRIYPMGLSKNSSCMAEFNHDSSPVEYRLPLRSCNTMSTQLENGEVEYFNTVVVQPHRKLVTNKGRGFHVRCRYQPKEETNSFKVNSNSSSGELASSVFSAKMPGVTMRIYNADTNNIAVTENVKVGDPLNIVIGINDTEEVYGLYITDCLVQDGLGWSEMNLIDEYGCPVDPIIMDKFKYNEDLTKAVVRFQAHKFPHTASVYYQCSVHLCTHANDGCKHVPPNCDSKRRSRRHDGHKANQDEGSQAMIEVYSGLYVNEATETGKPEQMDQVSEKALDDSYSICVSQRSFAVGIAIAGLVLMLLTVIAVLCILTRRRTLRKDISTTGSSIYSGPYTNTAYSHTS